ncbi:MAG: sulfurtransferase, partial [Acidobacteria bacterium]
RSLADADVLRSAGIEAYSVAGGTAAWRAAGRQVETGAYVVTR